MSADWLTLSDVAGILGIHPSTVRSWSDHGVLPVHRTQGGHRRYLRSEVELWMQSQQANGPSEADLVVQNALRNTRFQISEGRLNAEPWYAKLDEEARDQYRQSGRALLHGLISYLSSNGKMADAEAQALGYEYASHGRRCGLSIADSGACISVFSQRPDGIDAFCLRGSGSALAVCLERYVPQGKCVYRSYTDHSARDI